MQTKPNLLFFHLTLVLVVVLIGCRPGPTTQAPEITDSEDEFVQVMNQGKNYYENGDAERASSAFLKAVELNPADPDAQLNLANAYLLANQPEKAIPHARESARLSDQNPAAYYVEGCAQLRLQAFEEALKLFQQARQIDPNIPAVAFQTGRAHLGLNQLEAAETALDEATQLDPEHPAAWYILSTARVRLNKMDEANQALEVHRQITQDNQTGTVNDEATFERCVYTEIRAPFPLEQPDQDGIRVTFTDATAEVFPEISRDFKGPLAFLDVNRRGQNDLFALGPDGFQILINSNGVYSPFGLPLLSVPDGDYRHCLVGDFQNDRYEDIIVLGTKASHAFKFGTNGTAMDLTAFCGLNNLTALNGLVVDLDFTGNLDLLTVDPDGETLKVFRNLGNMYFQNSTTSSIPSKVEGLLDLELEDWNNDDLADILIASRDAQPLFLIKERGGNHVKTEFNGDLPTAKRLATGDLNNDMANDLVLLRENQIEIRLSRTDSVIELPLNSQPVEEIRLFDYDNDGWLDVLGYNPGLRFWRNKGDAAFEETTQTLGTDAWGQWVIRELLIADTDCDGDSDILCDVEGEGLKCLRNEGGNANHQLKVKLIGNRTNASGIGIRLELKSGTWRTIRTVKSLPIEIGTGRHAKIDSVNARWTNFEQGMVDVESRPCEPLMLMEFTIATGSCPYLYAWDGSQYRFVTDLLGGSPLGLRLSENRLVEADPDEWVHIGNHRNFRPLMGYHTIQITEELQEILYLDQAKLAVVDHPANTEVYPSTQLLPGRPFGKHDLILLKNEQRPLSAIRSDGADLTLALQEIDQNMASPVQLRGPHLRGLAEPFSISLDFGVINTEAPLVLAMTGWLHFGGATANVAASLREDLPFPFPTLEALNAKGEWVPLAVQPAAPAGKTKRMFIDLEGLLPPDTTQLRWSSAFEIHWDKISLMEKADPADMKVTPFSIAKSDLQWRGYSALKDLSYGQPLSPDYQNLISKPKWRLTPSGWATRYGNVNPLLTEKDNKLAIIAAGDALTLQFDTGSLEEPDQNMKRDFFLFTSGWDKDADPHVVQGTSIDPLPWHSMDDQRYGMEHRPEFDDEWIETYNTRWVGPRTYSTGK